MSCRGYQLAHVTTTSHCFYYRKLHTVAQRGPPCSFGTILTIFSYSVYHHRPTIPTNIQELLIALKRPFTRLRIKKYLISQKLRENSRFQTAHYTRRWHVWRFPSRRSPTYPGVTGGGWRALEFSDSELISIWNMVSAFLHVAKCYTLLLSNIKFRFIPPPVPAWTSYSKCRAG